MKKILFPVLFGLTIGLGFSACGGGGGAADALAEERAKLDAQQAKIDRIKILQAKVADGTITNAEQKELDDLYIWLEEEGRRCKDGTLPPAGQACPGPNVKKCSGQAAPQCPASMTLACNNQGQSAWSWVCQ